MTTKRWGLGALLRLGMMLVFCLTLQSDLGALHLCQGFLPENSLKIPVGAEFANANNITQESFDRLLNDMQRQFAPMVSRYGGQLVIEHLWNDSTVNAYAKRQGNQFIVSMMGGLARHPQITLDGLALVVCHEIGHHIAGVPRYANNWASTEGQSDYFASLKCLREFYQSEADFDYSNAPAKVVSECRQTFQEESDIGICVRSSLAGQSGANVFWALKGGGPRPDFTTPDTSSVAQTYESHPAYQCRMDTYFAGSFCEAPLTSEIGQQDYTQGTCDKNSSKSRGGRPRCWFAPTGGNPNPNPNPQVANTPSMNGQTQIIINNPNMPIPIVLTTGNITGAAGMLLEISKPNATFSNPNGNAPDPQSGLGYESARGTSHIYTLSPVRQLPGWGVYQVRVLALDQAGRAVGRFSNSATIVLRPGF